MTANTTVHHEQVAALHGASTPVRTRWSYRADEPFAVTVAFCAERGRWVEWVFARDLLIDGLSRPAGIGDLRVRPGADRDSLVLEISSTGGNAVFELDRESTEEFLATTLTLVPAGDEDDYFDADRLVEEISQA
ncbi:MAG TPA: SsgA family sporulation/cell division regulator [Pseudonocardiaceae bacterium]|jgi:hypothetical protein|nr:SsgA family sporulation/cell division regulator [Pseudonocardiaceae bacterium]